MFTNINSEPHFVYAYHTCMCYNRDAFIPYMHMDLRSFLNILVFNKLWEKGIVDSSKDGFENGDD